MLSPPEFVHLARCFYQGSSDEVDTMEEWVDLALRVAGKERHAAIKKFLSEMLAQNPDEAELQRIWLDADPDYSFLGESLRGFLILIRDRIP